MSIEVFVLCMASATLGAVLANIGLYYFYKWWDKR